MAFSPCTHPEALLCDWLQVILCELLCVHLLHAQHGVYADV